MRLRRFAAFIVLFSACIAARADLLGSSVTASLHTPGVTTVFSSAGPVVVGSGIEFAFGSFAGYQQEVDVTGTQIIITTGPNAIHHPGGGVYALFFDFTGAPNIFSVVLDDSSTATPASFLFTGTEIRVDLQGTTSDPHSNLILDVNYTPTALTPEASTFALLATGVLGILCVLKRRPVTLRDLSPVIC